MSRAMSTLLFLFPHPLSPSFVLYSFHTPPICGIFPSSLHASISIFARRSIDSSSFFNPFFLLPAAFESRSSSCLSNDDEFNDCCSYFVAIVERCRVWLMHASVNYTVNVKKKRGGDEGEDGWVYFVWRMREYMLKCASRRTICGVISGCEGIVNARATKRNCFWGYGSAEKYGFTARRMRISLTNVSVKWLKEEMRDRATRLIPSLSILLIIRV